MEISLKQEFKLLWKFYLLFFLWAACSFVIPFWILYFIQIGLSYYQISIIIGLSIIASLIFEVPTGAVADVFGRKFSVLLGLLISAVCLMLVPFFNAFFILFLIFFIMAAGKTFVSGADDAWFIDYLKQKKKSKLLYRAFARLQTVSAMGAAIAFALGGIIVKLAGIKPLWWIQGGASLIVFLYALLFVEEKFEKKTVKFKQAIINTFESAKSGANYVRKHPVLFWLVLAVFFGAFGYILEIVWQPFLVDVGLKLHHLGYLFALLATIGIIAPLFSTRLLKLFKTERKVLIFWEMLGFLFLFTVANLYNFRIIIVLYILLVFFGHATLPISLAYFQKHTPSETRATIGSLKKWAESLGGFIILVASGYIVDIFGLRVGILIAAIASIPAVICYLLIKEKNIKGVKTGVKNG